jgi:hypothetical protein
MEEFSKKSDQIFHHDMAFEMELYSEMKPNWKVILQASFANGTLPLDRDLGFEQLGA